LLYMLDAGKYGICIYSQISTNKAAQYRDVGRAIRILGITCSVRESLLNLP
jgi:hypothetical protein